MGKPPASGPHSDIDGVNKDARVGKPLRDPKKGTAADVERAERMSKGRPGKSGKLSDKTAPPRS